MRSLERSIIWSSSSSRPRGRQLLQLQLPLQLQLQLQRQLQLQQLPAPWPAGAAAPDYRSLQASHGAPPRSTPLAQASDSRVAREPCGMRASGSCPSSPSASCSARPLRSRWSLLHRFQPLWQLHRLPVVPLQAPQHEDCSQRRQMRAAIRLGSHLQGQRQGVERAPQAAGAPEISGRRLLDYSGQLSLLALRATWPQHCPAAPSQAQWVKGAWPATQQPSRRRKYQRRCPEPLFRTTGAPAMTIG
mmetsp:Transcript_111495/g.209142  ORF Transcript_111495/g.209142 Transcript_111495/m.209142 type:complete len:246 (-) Transcript_111495:62-799(-)